MASHKHIGHRRLVRGISKRYLRAPNRRWATKIISGHSEREFVELMNGSIQGLMIQSYDFKPLFVNRAYAENLGYTVQQVLSLKTIDAVYAPHEARRLRGYLRARLSLRSKKTPPTVYEVEARHRDGHSVILQNSVSLIQWKNHPAVLISAVDVTERYRAQQALELSEERFRDFAESASDWCWEMDEQLRFTYLSDSFERITGCPKQQVLGITRKEFMSLYYPDLKLSENEVELWRAHRQVLDNRQAYSHFEYNWYRQDGSVVIVSSSGKPIFNKVGKFIGYRGTATNITEEKKLSEQLNFHASHDELTGLINRRTFDLELLNAIDDAHVSDAEHVLVFMDLDRFKIVNDTCGHQAGDALLKQLAELFQNVFSRRDTLARLGGDEFAVIMQHCTVEQSMRITNRLHEEISRFRFFWDDKAFTVGVSAGVVLISRDSESVSRLLQNADSACYMAKENGRNKTHIFSEDDKDLSRRQGEMHWAGRITQALENDAFAMHAQVILPIQTSQNVFYEFLIRMKDGNQLIQPNAFLPAAERYDLSLNVDKWVLRTVLAWIRDHREALSKTELFFINLSGKTVGKKTFQDFAVNILREYQVPPEKICFEITETTAIANLNEAVKFIKKLKDVGCCFALDDFGSGVSSFAYLKNLPVDYLKIDGMFIRDMCTSAVNLAMVKSINEISHVMGKKTIAEFVENDAIFGVLRNMGVDYAQGYAIGSPFPIEELNDPGQYYRYQQ